MVKEVLNCLGIENFINSPTFTLIEPYEINDLKIFHIDLYRVEKITELSAIGLEEYLQEANSINFIEWPEKGSGFLKDPDIVISLYHQGETTRKCEVQTSLGLNL